MMAIPVMFYLKAITAIPVQIFVKMQVNTGIDQIYRKN